MTSTTPAAAERSPDDLPFLDIDSPEYAADRPGVLRAMREQSWIVRTRLGLELLTYDTCWTVRQGRVVTGFAELPAQAGLTSGRLVDHFRIGFGGTEGAAHLRLRQAAQPYFTPKSIERLRQQCRDIATDVLTSFEPGEPIDVVTATNLIPTRMFLAMIGMPLSDGMWLAEVSTKILSLTHRDGQRDPVVISDAYDELMAYAEQIVDDRKVNPGEDVVTALVHSPSDLDREEVLALFGHLLFGSGDNSSAQLALSIRGLADEPEQWAAFRTRADDSDYVRDYAVETTRMFPRQVRNQGLSARDQVWDGVAIPEGIGLIGNVAAGNRDPEAFPEPERFVGDRAQRQPLIFGSGPHICIGSHLARLEIEETLRAMAPRWATFEVAEIEQGVYHYHDEFEKLTVTYAGT